MGTAFRFVLSRKRRQQRRQRKHYDNYRKARHVHNVAYSKQFAEQFYKIGLLFCRLGRFCRFASFDRKYDNSRCKRHATAYLRHLETYYIYHNVQHKRYKFDGGMLGQSCNHIERTGGCEFKQSSVQIYYARRLLGKLGVERYGKRRQF